MDDQVNHACLVRAEVEKDLAANPTAQVVVAASPGAHAGILVNAIDQARQAGAEGLHCDDGELAGFAKCLAGICGCSATAISDK